MSAPLRVGVVGAGYFSRFHIDAWSRLEDARLVAVADLDESKAAGMLEQVVGAEHGVATFGTLRAMLEAGALDVLDIVAPPSAHRPLVELALEFPLRAIICQKPFCATLDEAREVAARIRAEERLVVIHENFRFQPWYRRLSRLIAEGAVGAPHQFTFRLRPGDGQGEDAYLDRQPYFRSMRRFLVHETAVHWIDTFRYLFGEPEAVFADLRKLNPSIAGEDSGYILYMYKDGRRALFDGNRLLDHEADNRRRTMGEAICEGTEGEIRLSGHGALRHRRFGETQWSPLALEAPETGFGGDCVHALQAHVCAHLTSGAPIENEVGAYLRNLEIENAVYRSAENGVVVKLTDL